MRVSTSRGSGAATTTGLPLAILAVPPFWLVLAYQGDRPLSEDVDPWRYLAPPYIMQRCRGTENSLSSRPVRHRFVFDAIAALAETVYRCRATRLRANRSIFGPGRVFDICGLDICFHSMPIEITAEFERRKVRDWQGTSGSMDPCCRANNRRRLGGVATRRDRSDSVQHAL